MSRRLDSLKKNSDAIFIRKERFTIFYSGQYKRVNMIYLLEVGTRQEDISELKLKTIE